MSLFKDQDTLDVVTPDDVARQTGVSDPEDLGLEERDNPKEEMSNLFKEWIEQIASHIHVRLGYKLDEDDEGYNAIRGILIGNVANAVTFAIQQRRSPIVQLGDYAVDIIQASQVTKNLDDELAPFRKAGKSGGGWADVFWSGMKVDG